MLQNIITDIFFDLDHTLWDFEKNSALTIQLIFEKHQIGVNNINQFITAYNKNNYKYWELFREDKITQEHLRLHRLKDSFQEINYAIEDERILFLADQYVTYLPEFGHLFEDTLEILDYLKPKYKLHIITNGFAELQDKKLRNSKIDHYFETVTNSDSAQIKKPNPLIYEYALTQAKAQKETSIMIGDCIESDIFGALNAGLDAIWYTKSNTKEFTNIKRVSHLLALKKYL
jgi:YjjG family noncanonical pyrimidine nucleotidase